MASDTPTAAEIQKVLGGIDYPATKDEVCETAKSNEADDRIMTFLEQIPEKEYSQPTEISEQLSEYTSTDNS